MAWTIEIGEAARRDLKRMDPQAARRITRFLRERIDGCEDPRSSGRQLTGRLGQYWRYRVGDYRVICTLEDSICRVLVVRVGYRGQVYR